MWLGSSTVCGGKREGVGKVAPLDSLLGQDNTDFLPRKSSVHTDTDKPGEISELSTTTTRFTFNHTYSSNYC